MDREEQVRTNMSIAPLHPPLDNIMGPSTQIDAGADVMDGAKQKDLPANATAF